MAFEVFDRRVAQDARRRQRRVDYAAWYSSHLAKIGIKQDACRCVLCGDLFPRWSRRHPKPPAHRDPEAPAASWGLCPGMDLPGEQVEVLLHA